MRAMSELAPHFRDWKPSGERLIVGFDATLYPENERVVVCEVNPSGEAAPWIDQEWRDMIAAAPEMYRVLQLALDSWFNGEISEVAMHTRIASVLAKARGEEA